MDSRLEEINNLLIRYSLGDFDYSIQPSERYDEIDAFITNINMLGEELKTSVISRDYFNNIFHSVSDMLLVLDNKGDITSINKAVTEKFKENGRDPHKGDNNDSDYKGVNPWKKETFNLTEQAKLIKSLTPELVEQLKKAAGV